MPPGRRPGTPKTGGRKKGTKSRSTVTRDAQLLVDAGLRAHTPQFKAWDRLMELAEDIDARYRDLMAVDKKDWLTIAEVQDQLRNTLKDLLPYERPKLSAIKVYADKTAPMFDLTTLADNELLILRRLILKARQVEDTREGGNGAGY